MRLIRQCGLSAELFLRKTKLRQVRLIRRAAYLPENTVYILIISENISTTTTTSLNTFVF